MSYASLRERRIPYWCVLLCLALNWTASSASAAVIAATIPGVGANWRADGQYTVGSQFTTGASPLSINTLGVMIRPGDNGGNFYSAGVTVGLWDNSGNLLRTTKVLQAQVNDRVDSNYAYVFVAPITLSANTTYRVGAVVGGGIAFFLDNNGAFAGSGVTLDAAVYNNGGTFTYPNSNGGTASRWGAANANFLTAGTSTWNGGSGSGNNLTDSANWGGTPFKAGDHLVFAGSTRLTPNNNILANTGFSSITFDSGASSFTLGGNAVNLLGDVTNNSTNLQTINTALVMDGGSRSFNAANGDITVGGVISQANGTHVLVKTGAGTLTLSAANTYTGGTLFNNGVLAVNHATALGSAGNLTFTGGTLQYTAANTANYASRIVNSTSAIAIDTNGQTVNYTAALASSNTGGLTKLGAGTLRLSATNSGGYSGTTTVDQGVLELNALQSLPTATALTINNGGTVSIIYNSNNAIHTLSGVTINAGGVLSSDGTSPIAQTLLQAGTNAVLNLNGGTLAGNANTTGNYGQFYFNNTSQTNRAKIVATGDNQSTISAGISFNGLTEINVSNGAAPIDLLISGRVQTATTVNGYAGIEKTGAGTLALTNTNNSANPSGAYGLQAVVMKAGKVIFANGALGAGAGNGNGIPTNITADFAGNSTLAWDTGNTQDLTAGSKLRIQDGVTATFDTNGNNVAFGTSFVLGTNKTAAMTKTGAGTLTLTAANTYTGTTTVSFGTLLVNNTTGSGTGTGAVVVSGGILGGTGIIGGPVTVNTGTLSPGASTESLATGTLTLNGGSNLLVEIYGLNPGAPVAGYDQLLVTGGVTLGGNLQIDAALGLPVSSLFTIIVNDGADAVSGIFSGLADDSVFVRSGYYWQIDYNGGTGNDVVLEIMDIYVVPEPCTLLLAALGGVALVARRLRRRRSEA